MRHCGKYIVAATLAVSAGAAPQQAWAAYAQQQTQAVTVTGKVTDDTGAGLPGVNVLEKGTLNGTVTDIDGNYRITVGSSDAQLAFSFVGMASQTVVVGTQGTVNVTLNSDASTLSEVVVVGYGTQNKRDVTGSMTSVKRDDFNKGIVNSPEQLLQGKVAGVNVTSVSGEPGGTQGITIRGAGSVRSGSQPLYVIDGVLLDNSNVGTLSNPLNFLNPSDIESIDVQKDASATAIYGSRGANGVILITTKRGKQGQSSVSYNANLGIGKLARKIDVFTADEFRANVQAIGGELNDMGYNTDWQDEITRTAITKEHNLSMNGGSDKLTYFASAGLQDQEGVIKNNSLKRYTGRMNVTQKLLNDRVSVDMNLNVSQIENERPNVGTLIGGALATNPTYPAYDENGNPYPITDLTNPLSSLSLYKDFTETTRILANISPSVNIVKGLTYKLNFGIDRSNENRDVQTMPSDVPQNIGRLDADYTSNTNRLIENYITYTLSKDAHAFTFLAGHSYQKTLYRTRHWSVKNFAINGVEPINNPGLGSEVDMSGTDGNNRPSGEITKNEIQSFFGRLNYSFKERYMLTATVRADGSSKFGKDNQYGTFPSFAAGWIISEEPFMANVPVSLLKLRAGWGRTGNQEIPSKIKQARFTASAAGGNTYPLFPGATYPVGLVMTNAENKNLQWEVSEQTDFGLDFGLLGGALSGTVDYFRKVSSNVLLNISPADPIRASSSNRYWNNVKDMEIINKGVEIGLDYKFQNTGEFRFNVGGNITFLDSDVKNSPFTILESGGISGGAGLTSATVNGYINGEPIGTFYIQEFMGIGENGQSVYSESINGDNRRVLGSAQPTKLYAFNAGASYKGFDLSVNFNGVSGNKVYDATANMTFTKIRLAKSGNTTGAALEYPNESNTNSAPASSRYLKDGAFLRLNNATLGYNFSPAKIGLENWIRSLRLSVTGQNLFLITDYTGYDPEVNADRRAGSGESSYGIDYLSYPKAKTVTIGLNVTF